MAPRTQCTQQGAHSVGDTVYTVSRVSKHILT